MACPVCGENSAQADWPISIEVSDEAVSFTQETPEDAVAVEDAVKVVKVETLRCRECSTRYYIHPNYLSAKIVE